MRKADIMWTLRLDEKRAAVLAVLLIVIIAVAMWPAEPARVYLGLLVAPPLMAATRCRARVTAAISALALSATLIIGAHVGNAFSADFNIRLLAVLFSGGFATVMARETREAERSLASSEARFRALTDTSAAGVWSITPDGSTLYVNQAMCRMLEVDGPQDLAGRTYHEFFTPESLETIQREHTERRARGEASSYEVVLVGRQGTRRRVLLSGAPLLKPDRTIASLTGTFIDVTERRRLERVHTATYRISEAVHAVPTLQELYVAIHRIVSELMPARNLYIALIDHSAGLLRFPYSVDEYDPPRDPRRLGKGLTDYIVRTGQPLLVTPDVMRDLERRGEVELIGKDSIDWLGVPLDAGGRTIGALVVQSYTEGVRYGPAELEILQFVSKQVAMAIERKRTEEALRESGQRLAQSQAIAHLGSWELSLTDPEVNRNPLWWSDETFRIFGYQPGQVEVTNDLFFQCVHPDDAPRIQEAVGRTLQDGMPYFVEHRVVRPDGTERVVQEQGTLVRGEGGKPLRMLGTVLDVTDERRLQDQLRQAQKMEAVGRLAGGMAHDFNNLLTAVLATSDLLAAELPKDTPHRDDIDVIRAAAKRGADLVKKLLAFSRQQHLKLDTVSLETLLGEFVQLTRRILPEDVEVVLQVRAKQTTVRADPVAVEQMLMNLVTNARDAMKAGGRLVVELDRDEVDAARCRAWGWGRPGEYVTLKVSDTGTGMEPDVLRRVFEPFFTTKPVGQGTGLGMAMVYGLVKQHDGYVSVDSEAGRGTSVCLYFPLAPGKARAKRAGRVSEAQGAGETILLVEDDETLRQSARRVLETSGYRVVTASDGHEALAWMEDSRSQPDLIISDVVMPRVSGPQMVSRLREAGRAPRVLFTSGYAAPDVRERAALQPDEPLLPKPWTVDDLLTRVREILDGPGA